jgi:diketogulonate reductase-like aldo/keto reductase
MIGPDVRLEARAMHARMVEPTSPMEEGARRDGRGRRAFLAALGAAAVSAALRDASAQAREPLLRAIPASGERLPVIGVGTWITFNVGAAPAARARLVPVLQHFFDRGGAMIDSSPMYGTSEAVIGELLTKTTHRAKAFAATKVWTYGKSAGIRQLESSRALWGVSSFDLVQIHNMLDWETHVETLQTWKAAGRLRYIGITTSHGRRHAELERALTRAKFDFVQFTYSLYDRDAERRLLPLAAERGIAVVANRPFDGGAMFDAVKGRTLPEWSREFDCTNWAQFFLKFIVSHPAVTVAIPATSKPEHMVENMGALYGRLPEPDLRQRMARHFAAL